MEPTPTSKTLDEKVVRTSPVLWILGMMFAFFLSAIGGLVLNDVADLFHEPRPDEFTTTTVLRLQKQRDALSAAPNPLVARLTRAEGDLADQERTLKTAEDSWRTWLATRATLGRGGNEDQEVRTRRNHLDSLRAERDSAEKALIQLRAEPDPRAVELADLDAQLRTAQLQANKEYQNSHVVWAWKVVAARLALVIPVWALGILLWNRRQQSKYITLLWGYWAFAAWMLLYGIGPYLPQYGGYLPLTLGAGTTVWLAVSLVRRFNNQTQQRRRHIVDVAISKHVCPGCERDYLIGMEDSVNLGLGRKAPTTHYDVAALRPRACPACGLRLYGACGSCGHVQVVHQDYCAACGVRWDTGSTT